MVLVSLHAKDADLEFTGLVKVVATDALQKHLLTMGSWSVINSTITTLHTILS